MSLNRCLVYCSAESDVQINCVSYLVSNHLNINIFEYNHFCITSMPKVCFVVCDNGFSQIFYNCSNVEEIFSWHN